MIRKTILTILIALMAVISHAETYSYLKFTKTDKSTMTFSVEGLILTYDDDNIYVTNNEMAQSISLAEVQDMYFSNESGTSNLSCDVNGDGEVNIADINAVIDMILGGDSDSAGDVNGDGEVNIADINMIIDYLLGVTSLV